MRKRASSARVSFRVRRVHQEGSGSIKLLGGGGFYDRAINSLRMNPIKIGLSYEFQFVGRIPTTAYDRPVEKIVTENRIIAASRNGERY